MSFAAAFHMLLPLFSYTGLVESAALPPLLIGYGKMIVRTHHNMLKQEETKRRVYSWEKSGSQNWIGTNYWVPPRMGMDEHPEVN